MPYTSPKEFIKQQVLSVKELGEKYGYGEIMCLASALWRRNQGDGAFVPQIYFNIKKKALKQQREELEMFDQIVAEALENE